MTSDGSSPKLAVKDVWKAFHGRKRVVEALAGVTFELEENEFTSLVGASGCGKSTLLFIVGGLEAETRGEVLVDGTPVEGPGRDRGMVFQTYTLFPWLTAQENIEFALRGERLSRRARSAVAREHLALVGLSQFADVHPSHLSGGMRQRVAIARALCYKPSVLLMDEPFGALDAQTRQSMQELLTAVWEQHRLTVLFVTHDIDEAIFISDRVLVMTKRPGRIKLDVRIELARPRRIDALGSDEFRDYKSRLLTAVREESKEGLQQRPPLPSGE